MIGSGIFKKSAVMAGHLHSPGWLLLTWVLAGAITCAGALSNAEVAGMFPRAGGQYVYFRKAYNDFVAFLYGWAIFAVIQTGSIASIAYVFAEYLGYFVHLPRLGPELEGVSYHLFCPITVTPLAHLGLKLLTVAVIALLTGLNTLGVALGGAIQSLFTTLKVAAERRFDLFTGVEQLFGAKLGADPHAGVEERGLVEYEPNRLGVIGR